MARIAGVNIANHQHAEIALQAIYGVGRPRAQAICAAAGINKTSKIKDLSESEMEKLRVEVSKITVEGDLRRQVGDHRDRRLSRMPLSPMLESAAR